MTPRTYPVKHVLWSFFVKTVNSFQPLATLAKKALLVTCHGPKQK